MNFKRVLVAAAVLGMAAPTITVAQGLVGGAERGADRGADAAGPVGAVVGGAVGAATGTVNGALGIGPRAAAPCGSRTVTRQDADGNTVSRTDSNC